jgi:hypothetical protein
MRLDRILELSKRRAGIQLPPAFVRAPWTPRPHGEQPRGTTKTAVTTPLVRMLRGGHGGEVRLKLYLCVTLLASHPPFDINRPIASRAWAEMLGLPDPEANGARRIADAFVWLNQHQFLAVERRGGTPPRITLLDPTGDGTPYTRPTMPYVTLPVEFWDQQWITVLSGTATALLLILLDLVGGKKRAPEQSLTPELRTRYALSNDSWTRATSELVSHRLVRVGRASSGPDLEWRRSRNTYAVIRERLRELPGAPSITLAQEPTSSVEPGLAV